MSGINDLNTVWREVHIAAAVWEDLGLALLMKPHTLETIKHNNSDVRDRLKAALSEWLKGNGGERSWRFLSRALKDPMVGRPDIAEAIETKYL